MKFCVLASGSKGNSTYVETKNHHILLDLGTTCLNLEKRMKKRGIDPSLIDIVMISHAHVDHVSALPVFIKKHHPKVFITEKIEHEANLKLEDPFYLNEVYKEDDLVITPIKTSHDVEDSNGFLIEEDGKSLVYITDTGYVNEKYHKLLKNKNVYIFESNHDVEKLMNNPHYPHQTKIRILSDRGHLSNVDSSYYLAKFIDVDTKYVILAHLSEENNTPDLALNTLKSELESHDIKFDNIWAASQVEPSELWEL